MVATRRKRARVPVPETVSPTPSLSPRDIDIDPRVFKELSVPPNNDNLPSSPSPAMPRSQPNSRSPSRSAVSFAGPGQRGARLLALATGSDRNAYLNAFDNMNDEFADQLRTKGVGLPGGESSSLIQFTHLYLAVHHLPLSWPSIPDAFPSSVTLAFALPTLQRYTSMAFAFALPFLAFAFALHCSVFTFVLPS